MKIIEPSVELIDDVNAEDVYKKIERCGRVCYQSQPPPPIVINEGDFSREEIAKISTEPLPLKKFQPRKNDAEPCNDSARNDATFPDNHAELCKAADFIRKIIKRGHESVLEHVSLTFHIICDRAIMAELTRHRLASFSVESTRYCKYDELEVIAPVNGDNPFLANLYHAWEAATEMCEKIYCGMIRDKYRADTARAALPLCTKTELYMTCNLREWRHVLKLRTAPSAHPQMRVVAGQILDIFRGKLPVIVEDITP